MKQYDVICPNCGTMNRGLYLEETDGWMICEHCHAEVHEDDYKENGILSFTNAKDQTYNGVMNASMPMATGWT